MVEMGCTNWEAGLTSSDISVSPSIVMPRRYLLCVPQASKSLSNLKPSKCWGRCWQHRHPFGSTASDHRLPFLGNFFKLQIFSLRPPTFLSTKTNELTN